MAELVRVEPSKFCDGEAWFIFDDGTHRLRKIKRGEEKSSDFPAPMIIRDSFDAPIQSMANGKWYDSKSGLAASYLPSGNPQGMKYECVGNEDTTKFEKPKRDKAKVMESISRAAHDMGLDL